MSASGNIPKPAPTAQNSGESEFRTWTRETTVSHRTSSKNHSSTQNTATTNSTTNVVGAGGGNIREPRSEKVSNQHCVGCKKLRNLCSCVSCTECKRSMKSQSRKVFSEKGVYCCQNCFQCAEEILGCGCRYGDCSCHDYDYEDDRYSSDSSPSGDWSYDEDDQCMRPSGAKEQLRKEEQRYTRIPPGKTQCLKCKEVFSSRDAHPYEPRLCCHCV